MASKPKTGYRLLAQSFIGTEPCSFIYIPFLLYLTIAELTNTKTINPPAPKESPYDPYRKCLLTPQPDTPMDHSALLLCSSCLQEQAPSHPHPLADCTET